MLLSQVVNNKKVEVRRAQIGLIQRIWFLVRWSSDQITSHETMLVFVEL